MVRAGDVYKKVEEDWVSRFIMDEVVIMPLCRSEADIQYIYSISNQTGSRIWQLLDGAHSVGRIQETIEAEYQGSPELMEKEIRQFLEDVVGAGLIQKVDSKSRGQGSRIRAAAGQKGRRSPYQTPEIARVKMQPEQAVLACCDLARINQKIYSSSFNYCSNATGCGVYPLCSETSGIAMIGTRS